MSFQAYLDTIEDKTGLTPREFVELAHEQGFDSTTKAGPILAWRRVRHPVARRQGHQTLIDTIGAG